MIPLVWLWAFARIRVCVCTVVMPVPPVLHGYAWLDMIMLLSVVWLSYPSCARRPEQRPDRERTVVGSGCWLSVLADCGFECFSGVCGAVGDGVFEEPYGVLGAGFVEGDGVECFRVHAAHDADDGV